MDNGKDMPAPAERPADQRLIPQSLMLFRAFMASPQRNRLFLLGASLVAVIALTAFGQVKLNAWNQPFYDALERRNMVAFVRQLGVFAIIAGCLLVLNVAQAWLNLHTKLRLREGLTRDLINEWMEPKRAFRLSKAGDIGINPDQRIHEDARHLTELSTDLALGLLQSSLLLVTFVGILWGLSSGVVFKFDTMSFSIPGYMVWAAILYAAVASFLSWRIGRPLISLNAERYGREADLRFALVRANERTESIAIYGDEPGEELRLNGELDDVLTAMRRIISATVRLTFVTAGYGWFTIIAPIIVAAPGYFAGNFSFGGMMMAVGAFNQVQQSLRWFVDNFGTIADWRATLLRIATFRAALVGMEAQAQEPVIDLAETGDDKMVLDHVCIEAPTGAIRLSEPHVEIAPGHHVVIAAAPGVEKTLMFQAIAGLWQRGSGRIELPPHDSMAFVPRRPYIPVGPLRAALAYPAESESVDDATLAGALAKVGLDHLSQSLDRRSVWDQELTDDEQQLLAFARLSLQQPRWVIICEALDGLDEESRERVLAVFADQFADAAVVNIGRSIAKDAFFSEEFHLVRDGESTDTAEPEPEAPAQPAQPRRLRAAS